MSNILSDIYCKLSDIGIVEAVAYDKQHLNTFDGAVKNVLAGKCAHSQITVGDTTYTCETRNKVTTKLSNHKLNEYFLLITKHQKKYRHTTSAKLTVLECQLLNAVLTAAIADD